jgi:hypothetical protein
MRSFLEVIEKCFKKLNSSRRRYIFPDYPTSSSREYYVYLDTYKIYRDVVKVLNLGALILKKI